MSWQDIKHVSSVSVYKGNHLAGVLERSPYGAIFRYHDDYWANKNNPPISFTLSINQKEHQVRGPNLHPFFSGLIPEGLRLKALLQILKTSEDDLFSLLIASGQNAIGDVWVLPEKNIEKEPPVDITKPEKLDFSKILKDSLNYSQKPVYGGEEHIPGLQDKVSVAMISLPIQSKKRKLSYILKLNPPDKQQLIENEHYFLKMAKDVGLDTPEATFIYDKNKNPGLLIKRFDRVLLKKQKQVTKVHQEDACQFLDKYPADKYRLSLQDIAHGFYKWCRAPVIEIAKLIHLTAFSYLIGNGDLHGKNISLMVDPVTSQIKMTPVYDLLSTLPYGDYHMALKMLGRDKNLKKIDFIKFGKSFGVNSKIIGMMLEELLDKSPSWISRLDTIGFSPKKLKLIKSEIQKRREDLK